MSSHVKKISEHRWIFEDNLIDRNPTSWMFGGEKVANYLTLPIMEVFTPAKLQAMNHAVYI